MKLPLLTISPVDYEDLWFGPGQTDGDDDDGGGDEDDTVKIFRFGALHYVPVTNCACVCEGSSPEGTETHAANHVEKRVKYEQTQQQIEEHGLGD